LPIINLKETQNLVIHEIKLHKSRYSSFEDIKTETFAMNLFSSKTRRNRAQKRILRCVNDDLRTISTPYLGKRGL